MVELLGLDSPKFVEFRMLWIGIVAMAHRSDPELYRRLPSFIESLPDLAILRPPAGNARPQGIEQSYFNQRKRGELPEIY